MITPKRFMAGLVAVTIGAVALPIHSELAHRREVMRSILADLENVAAMQGAYFEEYGTYTLDLYAYGYRPTHGSTVLIVKADTGSWEAIATHAGTAKICTASTRDATWNAPVCK